jgi:hypothetical protein
MRRVQINAVIVALFFVLTAGAQNKQTPGGVTKIDPLPRDLEIQLALSALPPHLRDNATVYVLNPDKGFEVARKGSNGFHALVARTGGSPYPYLLIRSTSRLGYVGWRFPPQHSVSRRASAGMASEGMLYSFQNDDTDQIHDETARQSRWALGIGLTIR